MNTGINRLCRKKYHRRLLLPTFISQCTAALLLLILPQILTPHVPLYLTPVSASGILTDLVSSTHELLFPPEDYIDEDFETKTLNIVEISAMRGRDIKRRLARSHGYDPHELSRLIDKKELINVLSFEEHKAYQQESERVKWIRFKTTVIYSCLAVVIVMFWPLVKHAIDVACVNFVVYTDRRKHEMKRCREFNTIKGYVGMFFLIIIDLLSFWLSTSVLLSWVMRSKWFFPVPSIPIRPAQLLTPKGGDAGTLGNYGFNVGPMVISFAFRFLGGRVEAMIGNAMSEALKRQKKREKEKTKRMRKEERAQEKKARTEAKRQAKKAKEESAARKAESDERYESSDDEDSYNSYSGMTASNVIRNNLDMNDVRSRHESETLFEFNDID